MTVPSGSSSALANCDELVRHAAVRMKILRIRSLGNIERVTVTEQKEKKGQRSNSIKKFRYATTINFLELVY